MQTRDEGEVVYKKAREVMLQSYETSIYKPLNRYWLFWNRTLDQLAWQRRRLFGVAKRTRKEGDVIKHKDIDKIQ